MGKSYMLRKEQVSNLGVAEIPYARTKGKAPTLSGAALQVFVWMLENPVIGAVILSKLKRQNHITKILNSTVIPDPPMFLPEFPVEAKKDERLVVEVSESCPAASRVGMAFQCLPLYEAQTDDRSNYPYLYWTIRDYAEAYKSGRVTPSTVAENFIKAVQDTQKHFGKTTLFCSFDPADIRQQAAASSERFAAGSPISVLDGIFIPVKDEVDCLPHLTNGGTTWLSKVREVRNDAVCVSRLRECGAILAGKTNMNELGMGVSGNNPHYGCVRNPHDTTRYSGGSAAGSVAVVSCGLCPAAIASDAGGSLRIPSSLCGTVGLKTTFGRTTLEGVLPFNYTLEVVCPAGATVEDTMLVYAAILGSTAKDVLYSRPLVPNLPIFEGAPGGHEFSLVIGSLKLGMYTDWFNDCSQDISNACKKALNRLQEKYGTKAREIVVPEMEELQIGHLVTVGSEAAMTSSADYEHGKKNELTYEVRGTMAYFRSFTNRDYIAAQALRRRQMYHHMQIFQEVDVIVTPTTGITAPAIKSGALRDGESNLTMTSDLMRYMAAANFVGLPAISVPVGHDSSGLPIGIQLMGRPWAEATLLQLAFAIEAISSTMRRRPTIFYDLLQNV
ncbi:hypothetical protein Mapa_007235 [Marchantia paleacea]|nr:hypothetical protein Mapa_007235 [Marchantia paleacea]